jgi:hypothetical protein
MPALSSTYQKDRRSERMAWINDYKHIKRCRYCHDDRTWVLHTHHRDPREKLFHICYRNMNRRWDDILAELRKCDIVCANCHAELHHMERQDGRAEDKRRDAVLT